MHRSTRLVVLLTLAWLASLSTPVGAQRMFLDTDGDGMATSRDALREGGTTVNIWIETNSRTSETSQAARSAPDEALSIVSYEFILHTDGGRVEWGKFVNAQPTMSVAMGPYSNDVDFYIGQMGMVKLPAGKYRLGALEVRVVSGKPSLSFAEKSSVWQGAETAFGSMYEGRDNDNTLKFFSAAATQGKAVAPTGDWGDAVGLGADRETASLAMSGEAGSPKLEFGIKQTGPAQSGALKLVVTTTRAGRLQLLLFSVSGRLVREIVDAPGAPPGEHAYTIGASGGKERLPAGVYYFKLHASEGTRSGKVVVLR